MGRTCPSLTSSLVDGVQERSVVIGPIKEAKFAGDEADAQASARA